MTDMSGMFCNCESLSELDVSRFDTSNVTDMSDMFSICAYLNSLDVSGFDTSNVTDMRFMFYYDTELTNVWVGEKWSTENAKVEDMFSGCSISGVTIKQ